MNSLIESFLTNPDIISIIEGLRKGMRVQLFAGSSGSARQVAITGIYREIKRPLLIVTHNMFSAQKIVEDLQECLSAEEVLLYPANELIAAETAISSPEMATRRLDVLLKLTNGFQGILVAPFSGVRRFLPDKKTMADAQIELRIGHRLELGKFLNLMLELGYERVDTVEAKGQMSVRGGLVDFFPLISSVAYRVEWFDDEIDSIRTFDPTDQRSIEQVQTYTVRPSRDWITTEERFINAAQQASDLLEAQLRKMTDREAKEQISAEISREIELLRQKKYFPEIYKYISLLFPERQTLLDYLPEDTILFMEEPNRLLETAQQLEHDETEWASHLFEKGKTLPAFVLGISAEKVLFSKKHQTIYLSLFVRQILHVQPQNIVNFVCRTMQNFHGQMNLLKTEMERWKKSGMKILLLAGDQERSERMKRVLNDYQIEIPEIALGNLQNGFELPSLHYVVVTEGEMFSQKKRKAHRVDRHLDHAQRIKSYTDLKIGDYVVHQNHGIGKYLGIGTLEVGGIHKDYLHIVYGGGDRLSVPVEQFDLIQKYVGNEEKKPKVSKLGGAEWNRAKMKARVAIKDIADDLIKLYAARQATPGYGFAKDNSYQQEFEEMFPYDETPDQLRSIREIKDDMETPRPMDRLLCGDVGYGKTEVAVRATFKSVIEGKQVAILVPTTILAQQHYETFRERFAGYPFIINVLSRFKGRKEQNETIRGLKTGSVDIVIGTHRVLSQDIEFKDLGLLIVDEEQRFGVTHKEKLKRLKMNVDVLTLTATPIPRTLHMSMIGVRDLSVIETPPENRFPVQTFVLENSPTLIREAVERELARAGQVYYLFNRVQGIYQMAEQIREFVPNAKVAVAHGQMTERELERTILDFLDAEYDVLVSTSIIETGVDIPNVNTLLVHDADKMGLSQLYQLRGRVGRSNRIAYAYFTYQRDKILSEVAEKRLQSIKEFTELGSGFKIAMRDLSIRGAGNLLGSEQHGFIASVGFEMYSQMLSEEIKKRKFKIDGLSTEAVASIHTLLDLEVDAYLPTQYICDSIQKIEIYKKVAAVRSLKEVGDLADELIDRFGDPPQEVLNLLCVARFKVYGRVFGIDSIVRRQGEILLKMGTNHLQPNLIKLKNLELDTKLRGRLNVDLNPPYLRIKLKVKGLSERNLLVLVEQFLVQYKKTLVSKEELLDVAP